MTATEVFGLGDRAVARRSDPETSHLGAESVKNISDLQGLLFDCFCLWGPMTDEELWETFSMGSEPWCLTSPSGLRSRRAELVAKGLLEWSGGFGETKAGRKARIWQAIK